MCYQRTASTGYRSAGPNRPVDRCSFHIRLGLHATCPDSGSLDRQPATGGDRLGSAPPQAGRRQWLGGLGAGVRAGGQGLRPGGAAAVHTQQSVASCNFLPFSLLVYYVRSSARYGYRPLARSLERLPRARRQPRLGLQALGASVHSRRIDRPPFPQLHGRQPVYRHLRVQISPPSTGNFTVEVSP